MTNISSINGSISALRAQLRQQAENALSPEISNTGFTTRLGDALRGVADAQKSQRTQPKPMNWALKMTSHG